MKRATLAVIGILILSMLVMGCSICSFVQRKGKEVVGTAVATVQAGVEDKLATLTPSAAEPTRHPTATASRPSPCAFRGGCVLSSWRYW